MNFAQQLSVLLKERGANVIQFRELNRQNDKLGESIKPTWQESTMLYLKSMGEPESIWNPKIFYDPKVQKGNINYYKDIAARYLYANKVKPDAMVSIHTNAAGGGTARGTEAYYNGKVDQKLGPLVYQDILDKIRRTLFPSWKGRFVRDDSIGHGYGEVFRVNYPNVLVELAFHNTPEDNDALRETLFQDGVARSTADSLAKFLVGRLERWHISQVNWQRLNEWFLDSWVQGSFTVEVNSDDPLLYKANAKYYLNGKLGTMKFYGTTSPQFPGQTLTCFASQEGYTVCSFADNIPKE